MWLFVKADRRRHGLTLVERQRYFFQEILPTCGLIGRPASGRERMKMFEEITGRMLDGTTCRDCGETSSEGRDRPRFAQFCAACNAAAVESKPSKLGRQRGVDRPTRGQIARARRAIQKPRACPYCLRHHEGLGLVKHMAAVHGARMIIVAMMASRGRRPSGPRDDRARASTSPLVGVSPMATAALGTETRHDRLLVQVGIIPLIASRLPRRAAFS